MKEKTTRAATTGAFTSGTAWGLGQTRCIYARPNRSTDALYAFQALRRIRTGDIQRRINPHQDHYLVPGLQNLGGILTGLLTAGARGHPMR